MKTNTADQKPIWDSQEDLKIGRAMIKITSQISDSHDIESPIEKATLLMETVQMLANGLIIEHLGIQSIKEFLHSSGHDDVVASFHDCKPNTRIVNIYPPTHPKNHGFELYEYSNDQGQAKFQIETVIVATNQGQILRLAFTRPLREVTIEHACAISAAPVTPDELISIMKRRPSCLFICLTNIISYLQKAIDRAQSRVNLLCGCKTSCNLITNALLEKDLVTLVWHCQHENGKSPDCFASQEKRNRFAVVARKCGRTGEERRKTLLDVCKKLGFKGCSPRIFDEISVLPGALTDEILDKVD